MSKFLCTFVFFFVLSILIVYGNPIQDEFSTTSGWIRTKPYEAWMREDKYDDFTLTCYRLGKIIVRFVGFS